MPNKKTILREMREKELMEEDGTVLCDKCGGTGEVVDDVWDDNSHTYQPSGVKPCICRDNDTGNFDDEDIDDDPTGEWEFEKLP